MDDAQPPSKVPASPRHLAALALVIILSAALVALGRAQAPASDLAVGSERLNSAVFTGGIYQREQHPDGYSYRWTSGSAVLQLRGAFHVAPAYLATLRLRTEHPAGPQPLTFRLNGQPLATVLPDGRPRTYRLLLPADQADHELRLNLTTQTFVAPGNPRPLGVELTEATLRPMARPDLGAAALVSLGLLLLWGLQHALGRPPHASLALVGLAGLGLAAMAALYRPAPIAFGTLAALCLSAIGLSSLAARLAARLGLAALCLIAGFSGVLWPAWLSDDAFISFRYAQNLAAGHGLVYNLGERVEGYTNFLWTILAALVIRLGGDVAAWSHLAGVALGLAIVLGSYVFTKDVSSPAATGSFAPAVALLTSAIVATSQSLLLYTARGAGLETGLFTLLLLVAVWLYLAGPKAKGQRPKAGLLIACGITLALLSMTRPEGILIAGIIGVHALVSDIRRQTSDVGRQNAAASVGLGQPAPDPSQAAPNVRRLSRGLSLSKATLRPLILAASFLILFLPYFLWRLSYYGDLLPNTFYAKTGGGVQQVLRGLEYAGGFALTLGGPLLLAVFVPWLKGWRSALASWRGLLLPVVLIYSAYVVAVGGDHFRGERFFVPILPLIALLLADGLLGLWGAGSPASAGSAGARWLRQAPPTGTVGRVQGQTHRQGWRKDPARPFAFYLLPLAFAVALTTGGVAALARTAPIDETMRGLDESVWIWREIGWWVADHGPPDASVAALGAGAVAYYSRHTTIDLLGLTDKHIGRLEVADMGSGVAGHEKRDPAYVLNIRRPTYIPQIWDDYFGGAPALRSQYDLVIITTRSGREIGMWIRKT